MEGIDTLNGNYIYTLEWNESPQSDVLVWQFPRYQKEIKMGAKLVVREEQTAILANEGRVADIYKLGTYTLGTGNMPILTKLMGWKYAFHSPFNAEVYFISMRQWIRLKWHNLIMMRYPKIGYVRIRMFGTYAFQVTDPKVFLQQFVLTDPSFETVLSPQKHLLEVSVQLRSTIVSKVGDVIRTAKIPLFDLADNYEKISSLALETAGPNLTTMGLTLVDLGIENISLPPEVEQARAKRTKTGVLRDMNRSPECHSGTVGDMAENPGATADADFVWGQQKGIPTNPPGGPPPMPVPFFVAVNGAQTGPYHMNALAGKARDGLLTRDTLVWKEGMAAWTPAGVVPELQSLFPAVPPPFPVMFKKMTG